MIDHLNGKDIATLFVEVEPDANKYNMEETIATEFRNRIGFTPQVKPVDIEDLPRSEKMCIRDSISPLRDRAHELDLF